MKVRFVIVAVAVLMSWGQATSLGAAEAVRLPMSCSYIANRVTLVPSPGDQLHLIVGDREHKTIRGCAPGPSGRCRNWEVHRFDVMCGGKQVSWRQVAGQILNLASAPDRRDTWLRTHLEPWEVRFLLAEPDFAPVEEFGGRIQSLADRLLPPRLGSRDTASAKTDLPVETAAPAPAGSPRAEQDAVPAKSEPPKTAAAAPSVQPDASAQPPSVAPLSAAEAKVPAERVNVAALPPPAAKADTKPADAGTSPPPDGPDAAPVEAVVTDAAPAGDSIPQPERSSSSLFPVVFASAVVLTSALVLILFSLLIFSAMMWRKWASSHAGASKRGIVRVADETEPAAAGAEAEPDSDAVAESCRELMKQVAGELVKAMTAVNSLRGGPALQTALHAELESIRRSLGFTPQIRGAAGEKKDWKQIKSQLVVSLQATQRIVGIAEAAHTSFSSVHPAALEVITTRLEAYAFLGVNANASEIAMKKAVNALRECWHPDLAADEEDRRLREIRIKQINVAWDLISGKQLSY